MTLLNKANSLICTLIIIIIVVIFSVKDISAYNSSIAYFQSSPSPTIIPDTATEVPPPLSRPLSLIQVLHQAKLLDAGSGYLAYENEQIDIDMENYILTWDAKQFGNQFTDFIMGANIRWGNDSEDDCGFQFRYKNNENFYSFSLNQEGDVFFEEMANGEWQQWRSRESNLKQQLHLDQKTAINFAIAAIKNIYYIILNGEVVYSIADETHQFGRIGVIATTFEGLVNAGCTFTDIWAWDLITTPPPSPVPTVTPYPSGFPTPVIGELNVAELMFEHGRMFWIETVDQIWILTTTGEGYGTWRTYPDTFEEGDTEFDPSIIPSPPFFQPVRGFGKIWRQNPSVRESLGWALHLEIEYKSDYYYYAGGSINEQGEYIAAPGYHILFTYAGEALRFEEDGTWRLN